MTFPPSLSDQPPEAITGGTLTLANAKLVLPDRVMTGSLTIEDGLIREITEGDWVPSEAMDCQKHYVMPGLVELHTDNLERHLEPRPAVDWPRLPALLAHDGELASTGITTVFDALRVGSIYGGMTRYNAYARDVADHLLAARAAGSLKISHFIHLRAEICSETLLEELAGFGPDDRVGIVSLMDHTPGQRQFRDLNLFRKYISRKGAMSDADFAKHMSNLKGLQDKYGQTHQSGAVAEAKRLGAVLASHDDTTTAQVASSQQNGVQFAEFPTTFEAAEACREAGIAIMMGAPNIIRGGSHSGNVSAAELADADLLDIVSSDYVPAALTLSAFYLAGVWNDLARAVRCITGAPAQAAGLTDRGTLALGQRGDVIRVGLDRDIPVVRAVWSRGNRVA